MHYSLSCELLCECLKILRALFTVYSSHMAYFYIENKNCVKVFTSLHGTDPVSYTHLDVYKRHTGYCYWRICLHITLLCSVATKHQQQ